MSAWACVLKPKAEADGSYPVKSVRAKSGEKVLRNIMLDDKIELYAPYVSKFPVILFVGAR